MSPSASMQQPSDVMPLPKSAHTRNVSTSTALPKAPSPRPSPFETKPSVHYTCFIRLPFPRNGFDDPPPVVWDAIKDRALWKLISKASNSQDLDWEEIASRFDVDLPFLMQQAAWLYERHFEGMRKQMQKLGVSQTPSPAPPESGNSSTTVAATVSGAGASSMHRPASKDSRMPSAINTLRGGQAGSASEASPSPGTPMSGHPGISRTPSATTVTQSRLLTASGRGQTMQRAFRGSSGSQKRPTAFGRPTETAQADEENEYALGHDVPEDSASEEEPPSRNHSFRRGVHAKKPPPPLKTLASEADDDDGDDDANEDSSDNYLPFAATAGAKGAKEDPAATLRGASQRPNHQPQAPSQPFKAASRPARPVYDQPDSLASSASSAAYQQATQQSTDVTRQQQERPGPLSPKYRAQLASLSPRSPRSRKDGSEGSPSMGSSFSDLDDASVTQSALEDALLSNMQGGGSSLGSTLSGLGGTGSIASRVGKLGEVLGGTAARGQSKK